MNTNIYYEFMEESYIYHMCWTIKELEELLERKFKNYHYINNNYDFIKVVKQTRNYKEYHYSSLENLKKNKYEYITRI